MKQATTGGMEDQQWEYGQARSDIGGRSYYNELLHWRPLGVGQTGEGERDISEDVVSSW